MIYDDEAGEIEADQVVNTEAGGCILNSALLYNVEAGSCFVFVCECVCDSIYTAYSSCTLQAMLSRSCLRPIILFGDDNGLFEKLRGRVSATNYNIREITAHRGHPLITLAAVYNAHMIRERRAFVG